MSKQEQLTAENETVVSSASRMAGGKSRSSDQPLASSTAGGSKPRKGKNID